MIDDSVSAAPATPGELLARGRTAEIYAWSDNQVLKLFFDSCPPEWVEREVDVGRWLASTSLPTPRLLGTVSLNGRRGIVFDRVEGHSMLNQLSSKPWLLSRMASSLAELHSAIHRVSAAELPPLLPHLQAAIAGAEGLPSDLKDYALDIIPSLPDGDALCHFDFHPDQVVLTMQGPMILDWMTALKGNPLADVARTSVLIRFAHPPYANRLMRIATNLARRTFHDRYIASYLRLHPEVAPADLLRWLLPVAAARIADNVPGEQQSLRAFLRIMRSGPVRHRRG